MVKIILELADGIGNSVPNLVAQTEKELVAWRPICYHALQGNLLRLESYKRERNTIKLRIRENTGYFELE